MAVLLCLSFAFRSGQALADEPASINGPDPGAQPAEAAFRQAIAQYTAGNLAGALDSMRQSYRLSQRFELLYNIARIESELGDCAASIADYRSYVDRVPQGRYRDDAERASRELEEHCSVGAPSAAAAKPVVDAAVAAPVVPPVAEPPVAGATESKGSGADAGSSSYWTTTRWIGWSLVATSTLAGAGALYFDMAGVDARDKLQDGANRHVAGGPPADLSLRDTQHRDQRWAVALAITGGAALTGGVALILFAPKATRATALLRIEPGLFGAQFSQRF